MNQAPNLSKSKIMSHNQCAKKLWLQTYNPEAAELDEFAEARMLEGTRAGEIAQKLFPGGTLVPFGDIGHALKITQELLSDSSKIIYEACLQADGVLIFIDILVPESDGYHLVEIKSSTKVKDYHFQDAAIQTWVARSTGLNIIKTSVGCIDNQFVYQGGGNYDGLFYLTDVSSEIAPLVNQVTTWTNAARETLKQDEPSIEMGSQCTKPFPCQFQSYCMALNPERPEFPLKDIRLSKKKIEELESEGYSDLLNLPKAHVEDTLKREWHNAIVTGIPYISADAKANVSAIPYPRYYFDFETVGPGIPIWKGARPYVQYPFQWSCHIEHEKGPIYHCEFLANPTEDPRASCAASLQELFSNLGEGSMVAYNASFEKNVLRELADTFPEYEDLFEKVCEQTYDLLPICRKHFYQRDMHGSWSIKAVLPAIAPELSYTDMDIGNGGLAQKAFQEMMSGEISPENVSKTRENLLKYCELDTWAMVKIAHYFEK